MNCQCSINWILPTDNILTTKANELKYRVYICENCKRYFIRRFYHLLEIDPKAQQVLKDGVVIKIPEEYLEKFNIKKEV